MTLRRILAAIFVLCAWNAPSHAQKTKATLNTEVAVNYPDNMIGFITPALARPTLLDIINSIMPNAPVVSGNLACFNGITGLLQDCGVSPTSISITAITGLGTGVATALGINVGTAGSPVINGGAGGTPSSIVLTNGTGLPTTALTGALQAAQEPAHTGDCTNTAGSLAMTCLDTNGVPFTATSTAAAGQLPATATNDNAASGHVGEYIESVIASGSATSLVTGTPKTITNISLTAGDWDVGGNISFITATSTSVTGTIASLSGTTNVLDSTAGKQVGGFWGAIVPGASTPAFNTPVGPYRLSLSGTTSVFLVAEAFFTASTLTGYGIIRARRIR